MREVTPLTRQLGRQDRRLKREQQADLVRALRDLPLQVGHQRLGTRHLSCRIRNVQIVADTCLLAIARELQDIALTRQIALADGQTELLSAQLDVRSRNIAQKRQEHVVSVLLRRYRIRICRLHSAAHASEQINLPRCIESDLVLIERVVKTGKLEGRTTNLRAQAVEQCTRRGSLADPLPGKQGIT